MFNRATPFKTLFIEHNPGEVAALRQVLRFSETRFASGQPCTTVSLMTVPQLQWVLDAPLSQSLDLIFLGSATDQTNVLTMVAQLQQHLPQVPLIVVDRHHRLNPAQQRELVQQGVHGYWDEKQIQSQTLGEALEMVIQHYRYSPARSQSASPSLQTTAGSSDAHTPDFGEEPQGRGTRSASLPPTLAMADPASLLAAVNDAVILVNLEGRIQHLNPAAERLTGWLTEMAQGHLIQDVCQVLRDNCPEPIQSLVSATLAGQRTANAPGLIVLSHRDQYQRAVDLSVVPHLSPQGDIQGAVVVCREVTPTRRLASQLVWQASHDSLTGLLNRSEFEFYLEKAVNHAQLTDQTHVLCYLDLDQFKIVNDTCGHSTGDELLRQVSHCLQSQLRDSDILARLGGDEFGLLLHNISLGEGQQRMETLVAQVRQIQFLHHDRLFQVGASIGIVAIGQGEADKATLLSAADTAMYIAKDRGGNRCHGYQVGDLEMEQRRGDMQWVSRLTQALEDDRFCLYVQAIAPIQPVAAFQPRPPAIYEVLLRLQDPHGNLVMPGAFIPAAERYHLMPDLDRWVIRTLFRTLASLPPIPHHTRTIYNINLSGASFNDDQFLEFVRQQFRQYAIAPSQICFEVTETAAIANLPKAVDFIRELRALGCQFALDDFGSGMSSLTYLNTLPVDYLKIDGQLIRPIATDSVSAAMIEAIVHISSAMGLETVAEFVEDATILQKIKAFGIDYAQGYAIAHPVPLADLYGSVHLKIG